MGTQIPAGYSNWVKAYDYLVAKFGVDSRIVVERLKDSLFYGMYSEQKNGLASAIRDAIPNIKGVWKPTQSQMERLVSITYTNEWSAKESIDALFDELFSKWSTRK